MAVICVLILLCCLNFGSPTSIHETIRLLPSPYQFTVRHRESVNQEGFARTLSWSTFRSAGRTNITIIDVYRMNRFTVNWEKIWTDAGDEIRISAVSKYALIGGGFFDFTFEAEALKSAPLDEVFATIMRTFGRSHAFETILCQNGNDDIFDRGSAALRGITKSQIQANNVVIGMVIAGGQPPRVTEKSLLAVVHSTGTKSLRVEVAEPWNLSDAFYRDPAVQKLIQIDLQNVTANGITDDALNELNATSLILTKAPEITPVGLRRFFDPILDGSLKERKIEFKPSFKAHTPAEIFKMFNYNVSQGIMFMLPSDLWVISPPAPARKALLIYQSKSNGLFSFKLFTY